MSWRKYLVIPQLIWYGSRAPRSQSTAWDRFWGAISKTGADGDVLWDAGSSAEIEETLKCLRTHLEPALPVVDIGCGNGRLTRALAGCFQRVLGLDASPKAIARAQEESHQVGNVFFRVADIGAPGLGRKLQDEFGPMNIFVRGVLHVLDHQGRLAAAQNFRDLLGEPGVLYLSETNIQSPLDHLEFQGATAMSMPDPLRRCIKAGIRPPAHFGDHEVRAYFPPADWERLTGGPGIMHGVALHAGRDLEEIPSYFAVLRPIHAAGASCR